MFLKDALFVIQEKLSSGGEVTINPGGISMKPLVIPGRDSVVLVSAPKKLKKYDVALYRRKNGQFVLHRVVGEKNGIYIMCGDNQYVREKNIEHTDVIALMSAVIRNKKKISVNSVHYKIYSVLWVFIQRINALYHKLRGFLGRIKRKILG